MIHQSYALPRLSIIIFLCLFTLQLLAQNTVDVISFNIRYNSANDGINIWDNRKDKVAELLNFYEADIVGLQEATYTQLKDLTPLLQNYKWIGVGRDDGALKGEFSPIFYRNDKFRLISNGHFWLSEETAKPNKGWDAALPRIATYGVFEHSSGQQLFMVNTHYDHKGAIARTESSTLITQQIKSLNTKNLPIIIMGDLNAKPDETPLLNFFKNGYQHSRLVQPKLHMGPIGTYNGFTHKERDAYEIDHILYKGSLKVDKTATLSHTWSGQFASDHHAVLAKFLIL